MSMPSTPTPMWSGRDRLHFRRELPMSEPETGAGSGELAGAFRYRSEQIVAHGWRIDMVKATFAAPDGETFERDVIRHPGAVAVVPVTSDGTVLLVEQYRGPVDQLLLEIPAGTRDVSGEAPERTAARELAEEVGVRPGALTHLCTFYNSPGFCDEETLLYLATELTPCATGRSGVEEQHMTVHEVALTSVDALVSDGTLRDGQTILGLLLARERVAATRTRNSSADADGRS